MRLSANLPHRFWQEIITSATYLYNRTPRASNNWMSPYEAFYTYVFDKEEVSGPRKPLLHHLRAYGCKAYVKIKSKGDPDYPGKLRKFDPRAHIGFLVGYQSTNIYKIWVPHKKKVIAARDVIFDEKEVWDGRPLQRTPVDIQELDEAIEVVEVEQAEETEDIQLAEDSELDLTTLVNNPDDGEVILDTDHEMDDPDAEKHAELADDEWAQNQLPTPEPSLHEAFLAAANLAHIPIGPNQQMTLKQGSMGSSGGSPAHITADSAESEGVGIGAKQLFSSANPSSSNSIQNPIPNLISTPYSNSR